jgi:hypothetical protein
MPLSDIAVSDYLSLFRKIDKLAESNKVPHDKSWQDEEAIEALTIINFQCVMGFSRSVGLTVLYLVYCGKLTVGSYQDWLAQHYPRARLPEHYLPTALIVAIASASRP